MALLVPVEVSSGLVDVVPAVVDKVPSAAERVRREVVLARFLGKMVVDQGLRELRSRLARPGNEVSSTGPGAATTAPTPPQPAPCSADTMHDADDGVDGGAPPSSSLALADYDHLSSAQIVSKLEGLDADERRAIERYERGGRCRRTILGKLAQLEALE